MRDDRSQILERIRQSQKSGLLPSARASIPPAPAAPTPEAAVLVEDFSRELQALGVKLYCPATPAEAIDTVLGLLREAGSDPALVARPGGTGDSRSSVEILAWDDSELPVAGWGEAVRAAGLVRLDTQVPTEPSARRARLAELGRAAAGLTGALAGLADTGTLVLSSGPGRPRLASLLPPVHIAVLLKGALYPSMAAFFAAHPGAVGEASNLVLITGPSRTADIEQTLTLGVHGPRQVHVVLVE